MVFERKVELNASTLPEHAAYRMAEVEMAQLLDRLTELQQVLVGHEQARPRALAQLLDMLFMPDDPKREEFKTAFSHHRSNPTTSELIHVLLYAGYSIRAASQLTGVVTQTIQRHRDKYPTYFPAYSGWNKELLQRYAGIRTCFNIHGEKQKLVPFLHNTDEDYHNADIYQQSKTARQKREAYQDTAFEVHDQTEQDDDTLPW